MDLVSATDALQFHRLWSEPTARNELPICRLREP